MDNLSSNLGFLELVVPYVLFLTVAVLLGFRILNFRRGEGD